MKKHWLKRAMLATAIPAALTALIALGNATWTDSAIAAPPESKKTASLEQPKSAPEARMKAPDSAVYSVKGFRSARFGMDEAQLRQAIERDLGVAGSAIRVEENALQRTRALIVDLPKLDPGPGNAVVSYVLGHKSKKLIQVNVVWGLGKDAGESDLQEIYSAANTLSYYFADYTWRDGGVVRNALIDPTTLMLFHGEDTGDGAAEIILGNVPITVNQEEGGEAEPSKPTGPAYLRVSYIADRTEPDIYMLAKGEF